ncbi:hypothetical protein [Thermus amyloliquefaciens]|uniref:hypothetical protein n=1 Tax=Thermus amyloliquefaciens TaxID=1449080 RepID=UPI00057176CD|nr:hypothetical protein [Thermus amyloliquefaciens]
MRLLPKRDGNPRRLFLRLFVLLVLATLGVAVALALEKPESLPLLLGLLLLELPLVGALLHGLASLPQRFFYELRGPVLTLHLPFGRRVVHRAEVKEVRPLAYALPRWVYRHKGETSMPGYHHRYLRLEGLPVEAFVGARRGEGVLLVLKEGRGLLLNPEDPKPLLSWKEEA